MRRVVIGMAIAGALCGAALRAQQKPQDIELQAAIRTETVVGDLRKAIAAYQAIVDKYHKVDRGVTASALVVTTVATVIAPLAVMLPVPPTYAATVGGLLGAGSPIRAVEELKPADASSAPEMFSEYDRTVKSSFARTVTEPA